jgi:hypothetical protein
LDGRRGQEPRSVSRLQDCRIDYCRSCFGSRFVTDTPKVLRPEH